MNYTRKCGDNSMECDGNYCSYSSNPIPEFSWWSEVTTISYSCTISPKIIAAKNISDNSINTKCKAKDKFCSLHDSIIVWDDTSYHSCPLYEISKENFVIHLNARNPEVLVALPNMAFQAFKTEKICGLNTMHTSEGVYLSLTKNKDVAKHPKNGADINEIKEILLADIPKHKTLKETLKKELNKYLTQDSNYNLPFVEYKTLSNFVWIALCRNIAAKFYKYVVYRHEQEWDEEPEPKNNIKSLNEISESYSQNLTSTLYQLDCIFKMSNINNINNNQHGLLPSKFVFHVSNKILKNFETLCWHQINNLEKSSIFILCKCLQVVAFASKLAKRSKPENEENEYEISSDEIQSLSIKVIDYMMFKPYSVFDNYQTAIGSILDRITKYLEP
ncbi:unnamed protein product [Brachionus calyciflorus]|uniref:Uncharacterized protein n=1 Tax=Brachionus calyciflorus TaxID=104777 RepID=A0A814JI19_9BILA|nr:unnamed protein product [Brachionus calyciflorus]